jgi:hypothetical protein
VEHESRQEAMPITIYQFQVVEGQDWVFPVDSAEFERFFALDGTPIENWHSPEMKLVVEQEEGPSQYSDFPWLGRHAPLLRKPAVDALGEVLRRYGQILPLRGERVWLWNVTNVLAALDEEGSDIVRFDHGDILTIERYKFRPDVIAGSEIFKLPIRASPVFVNSLFVERVRQADLKCVSFDPIWSAQADA